MTEPIGPVGAPMQCNRCGIMLNAHEQWERGFLIKLSWEHSALKPDGWKEHDPEPILLEENESPRVPYCDFCNDEKPIWSFPTSTFKMDISADLGWGSVANWAACQSCHDDIEANRWDAVHDRYFSHKAVPKSYRSMLRKEVEGLHRQFRLNRLGSPFRIR